MLGGVDNLCLYEIGLDMEANLGRKYSLTVVPAKTVISYLQNICIN